MSVFKTSRQALFVAIFIVSIKCYVATDAENATDPAVKAVWEDTNTDKLRKALFTNYDKNARPEHHQNKTIVKFGIAMRNVGVDEFKSALNMNAWLRMVWSDSKLKWNVNDYEGLSVLRVSQREVWIPDIHLYNSAEYGEPLVKNTANANIIVYPNGELLWVPPVKLSAFCNINLKYWPFDTQHCYLKFGSWTYDADTLDLELYNGKAEIDSEDMEIVNTQWIVVSTTALKTSKYYSCCPEPYTDITFNMTIARRSPAYKAVIIAPATVTSLLILMCFWLPPQSGQKIILNGCTAIILSLFMIYFAQKLPAMGDHTPLVVMYYSISLYIVCLSMAGSIAVIYLSKTQHASSLPWVLKKPLSGRLGRWLGLGHYIKQSSLGSRRITAEEMKENQVSELVDGKAGDEEVQIVNSVSAAHVQHDWLLLAATIDRISFIIYTIVFVILGVTYAL